MLRQVDSSLLDEWERMRDPDYRPAAEVQEVKPPGAEAAAADVTRDTKAFMAAIRTRTFTFLRALANGEFDQALAILPQPGDALGRPWTPERLRGVLDAYLVEHRFLLLNPAARSAQHTYVIPSEDKQTWRVQQMLVDPEDLNDWVAEFEVDLAASRAAQEPVMRLWRVGGLAEPGTATAAAEADGK
jgi:hypothetical protein